MRKKRHCWTLSAHPSRKQRGKHERRISRPIRQDQEGRLQR
jgi:hypothetical protein